MAGQPNPPLTYASPRNKGLIASLIKVHKASFLGGGCTLGGEVGYWYNTRLV